MYTVDRNIIHESTVKNKQTKKMWKKIKETEAEIISKEREGDRDIIWAIDYEIETIMYK